MKKRELIKNLYPEKSHWIITMENDTEDILNVYTIGPNIFYCHIEGQDRYVEIHWTHMIDAMTKTQAILI